MTKNPMMIAALAATALALGACGSGGSGGSGGRASGQGGQDKAFEGALKFAKCMRDEGVDMPDPQKQPDGGIIQKMGGPGERLDQAKVEAAQKTCQHFMDAGGGDVGGGDPQAEAAHRDALLAYAKCMRSHGVPMKDPKFSGNKVQMSIGGGSGDGGPRIDPQSTTFKTAEKACQPNLAQAGDAGPPQQVGK
ncbi:hypothetical protein [Baekduia sp.]|uniref:hypothetical protein n=1 Tax=Baekduia sp. TaxID=2600305 RepID=UPI002D771CD8|nr:hypothetical protein [Baekduia sp.]